jgi:hypothetical protein
MPTAQKEGRRLATFPNGPCERVDRDSPLTGSEVKTFEASSGEPSNRIAKSTLGHKAHAEL